MGGWSVEWLVFISVARISFLFFSDAGFSFFINIILFVVFLFPWDDEWIIVR